MRYFVIRGFGIKKDSQGQAVDFDRVDSELIAPALSLCGFEGGTTAQMKDAGSIQSDMFELIIEADVVVCDITVHNANVFYELGIRHALRKKHTVLIKGQPSSDMTPFDIGGFRYLAYPVATPGSAVDELVRAIKAGINGTRDTDSPVFQLMPGLPEARSPNTVPTDFVQEVQRARSAGDKGWLLMLAEDVRNQRFEWDGLRAVANAQWKLRDYERARQNWEELLARNTAEVEARLALSNIYERLYRQSNEPTHLRRSEEAIDALLELPGLSLHDRAETLALRGRNLKTMWREELRNARTVDERLVLACDRRLLKSYEAYREAFEIDLNAFFPGIAFMQVGAILLKLGQGEHWASLFDDEEAANLGLTRLKREWAELATLVRASVRRAIKRSTGGDKVWAAISDADLLFLTEDESTQAKSPARLLKSYKDAVPAGGSFEWDSTRSQLELFESLGMRPQAARAVIDKLELTTPRPTHVLVFAGHTVDQPGRNPQRFPATAEAKARALIEAHVKAHLRPDMDLVVLASAAPGADILMHEVCHKLGVPSVVCLPMPADEIIRIAFKLNEGDWRNRLLELLGRPGVKPRVLQADAQMPRWLRSRTPDLWERGNRWMIRTAQAWDADRRTLLALWDGDDNGGATGGTAHVWRLARDAGMYLDQIDSRQLIQ